MISQLECQHDMYMCPRDLTLGSAQSSREFCTCSSVTKYKPGNLRT